MKNPFDPVRLQRAARRYAQQAPPPEAAPRPAPGAERRKEWLTASFSRERALATVSEAEARGATHNRDLTIAMLARERILGSRDLRDINYLELAIAVARGVCRIRVGTGLGTGFLVGPRLLMTNNHVIESPDDALRAEAQFDVQENLTRDMLPVQGFLLDPRSFFLTDRDLDFTIVATATTSTKGVPVERYPWLQLIETLGKTEKGEPINVIQHPRGGLKQIALRNNEIIEIPEGKPDFLYYTTDTEPGSSGSPCLNDQWELVALHHSGVPRTAGGAILKKDGTPWREGEDDPALVDWIANEGARVSAIVAALRAARLPPGPSELRGRMLGERAPNPIELARTAAGGSAPPGVAAPPGGGAGGAPASTSVVALSGAGLSFTVPLTVTLSLGGSPSFASVVVAGGTPTAAVASAGEPTPVSPDVMAPEGLEVDPDWGARRGYDPGFLDVAVPLPTLSAAMKAASVVVPEQYRNNGDPHELCYHHYSAVMNKKRRFAWYSAANVDGDHRPKLPKRKDDDWHIDPRIDDPDAPAFQCGEELYATADTDRGHLTRYLDVAWGTKAQALKALADTFHFANCCLQLSGFNQGKDRWQGIEQYLLEKKARKEKRRITVITGPIFDTHDPYYRNEHMTYRVQVPLEFWKICAIVRDDDSLSATGFILGQQDVADLPGFEEVFDVVATQVTIAEIEQRTGLRFPVLKAADHFAAGGAPGTLEIEREGGGKRLVAPLRSLEDIVV